MKDAVVQKTAQLICLVACLTGTFKLIELIHCERILSINSREKNFSKIETNQKETTEN